MNGSLTLLLVISAVASAEAAQAPHNLTRLTFMLITSFGQFGLNASGAIPAAEIALEHINGDSDLLPGYKLLYDRVGDSQCHPKSALDEFFRGIWSEPVKLAVVGCGCSVATEPVAEISHKWNISQISYTSGLAALSDRVRFPRYFRNSPTREIVSPAFRSILDYFKWRKIGFITQQETIFTSAELSFRKELEMANITVGSRVFHSDDDPVTSVSDLFFEADDYRILVLNCYSGLARRIICEAGKRGLLYPQHVWIAFDWYPIGWWREGSEDCSSDMLQGFLKGALSLRRYPSPDDSNITTDAGITPMMFAEEYSRRAAERHFDVSDTGVRLYDVIWVLALALNNTMTMVEREDINQTGCDNVPGSLVPLEEFNYTNEKMGCLIQWNLQQTNFSGCSGRIVFDENGTIIHHRVRLRQYLFDETGNLKRKWIAYLDRTDNYKFNFEPGFSREVIYPDGVPLDGDAVIIVKTFKIGLVVVFDTLAVLGIAFAIGCLLFNFSFRGRKLVKLTSPSLNYFIILGAVLMYASMIFAILPSVKEQVVQARCILQHCLFTIGYSVSFGMVLSKMWRIYQIFHNPTPNKKVLKDRHLIAVTIVVTGITILLLLLETSVPYLRGNVSQEIDQEHPTGRTASGIRQEFHVLVCYEASSPSFFWQIFITAYLGTLQLVGIILSFQTRKVKVQGLRDSTYVVTIIYTSSIVLIVLALVKFSLRTYINIGTGIYLAGIFLLTTILLALIFIPKMVLLYKDPTGESVMEKSINAGSLDKRAGTTVSQTAKVDSDSDNKIESLRTLLKERDDKIAKLESEMKLLKVQRGPDEASAAD